MKARKIIALATMAVGLLGAGSAARANPQLCVAVRTPNHLAAPDGTSLPDVGSLPQVNVRAECVPLP